MDTLKKVADDTGRTKAQVALNWCLSRPNVVVIPKSDKTERVIENCDASSWSLRQQHALALDEAFA